MNARALEMGISLKMAPTPSPSSQGEEEHRNADAKSPSPLRGGVRGGGTFNKESSPQVSVATAEAAE